MSEKDPPETNPMLDLFLADLSSQIDALKTIAKRWEDEAEDLSGPAMQAASVIEGGAYLVGLSGFGELMGQLAQALGACDEGLPSDLANLVHEACGLLDQMAEQSAEDLSRWARGRAGDVEACLSALKERQGQTVASAPKTSKVKRPEISVDTSMMDLFRLELEAHVADLNSGLLRLEESPDNKEILDGLMRAAHSIKGAARVVNAELVSRLAHRLEDCFVAAQDDRIELASEHVDCLLLGVDILASLTGLGEDTFLVWLGEHEETVDKVVYLLQRISEGKGAPASVVDLREPLGLLDTDQGGVAEEVLEALQQKAEEQKKQEKPSTPSAPAPSKEDRILRVSAENLDRLMGLAGESLVEARWLTPFSESLLQMKREHHSLSTTLDALREELEQLSLGVDVEELMQRLLETSSGLRYALNDRLSELDHFIRRHSGLSDRLYREVITSRLRPFMDGVAGFPRMVRDVARNLGKEVELEIRGKNTPVDRDIMEKLEAPFNHILRNAIDHGIGTPEARIAAGKPPKGKIVMEARHRAGMLTVTLSDDGKGLDIEGVRKAVVRRGLVNEAVAERLSETELLEFLFLPGFTTSKKVTSISGRGVGLDVVQSVIQEVGGRVRIETRPGEGMKFTMHLPLTLSVIRALLAEISGEPYAFPLSRIDRALMVKQEDIQVTEGRQFIHFEGENIGLLPAHQVLSTDAPEQPLSHVPVVVISERLNVYGVAVDRFLGERELVVQELDHHLGKMPNISSGALMENGEPILIVDVEDLVRSMNKILESSSLNPVGRSISKTGKKRAKRVLVVEDSITVREVELRLLANEGYEVEVAVDGVDGWNLVRVHDFDLVITDIDMPRMNGFELTRLIRSHNRLKDLPVLIVSYKDRAEDREMGLQVGANDYFTKSSFHDERLLNRVKDLIGGPLSCA